jgi:hypothetical protein
MARQRMTHKRTLPMNALNFPKLSRVILFGAIAALSPVAFADVVVTESAGTVTNFGPGVLELRSEVATAPTSYVVSKDITYVDDAGLPIAADVVRSGVPVTVQFVREGDRVLARRVVVHRPVIVEQPAAVVEERTVVRPRVEERTVVRPRVEERTVVRPRVEERTVVRPRVEERTVVRPAPEPRIIEERKTTTTTTTTKD